MDIIKKAAFPFFLGSVSVFIGFFLALNLVGAKYYLIDKEIYECAVGIEIQNEGYCMIYAMKGFIPKDETPSSGRRNHNLEQGRPIRSAQ